MLTESVIIEYGYFMFPSALIWVLITIQEDNLSCGNVNIHRFLITEGKSKTKHDCTTKKKKKKTEKRKSNTCEPRGKGLLFEFESLLI